MIELSDCKEEVKFLIEAKPFVIVALFFDGMQGDTDGYSPIVKLTNISPNDNPMWEELMEEISHFTLDDLKVEDVPIVPAFVVAMFEVEYRPQEIDYDMGRPFTVDRERYEITNTTLLWIDYPETDDCNEPDFDTEYELQF